MLKGKSSSAEIWKINPIKKTSEIFSMIWQLFTYKKMCNTRAVTSTVDKRIKILSSSAGEELILSASQKLWIITYDYHRLKALRVFDTKKINFYSFASIFFKCENKINGIFSSIKSSSSQTIEVRMK